MNGLFPRKQSKAFPAASSLAARGHRAPLLLLHDAVEGEFAHALVSHDELARVRALMRSVALCPEGRAYWRTTPAGVSAAGFAAIAATLVGSVATDAGAAVCVPCACCASAV